MAAPSELNSTVALDPPTLFNSSGLTSRSNLQPAIDLANAVRVYGANPPPWMTTEYAFEPFSKKDQVPLGNVTSETSAYSSYVDCQTFPANDTASYDADFVTLKMNDRGCQIVQPFPVQNNHQTYIRSWSTLCSGSEYGRVGFYAAVYSATSPLKVANLSILSCVPSYWNTTCALTVSVQSKTPQQIISFTPREDSTSFQPAFYTASERIVGDYTSFDPSNTFETNALGFSVYNYAKTKDSTSPMQPEIIKNAAEELWTTLYAGLATTQLFNPAQSPRTAQGILSAPVTRLYVITPVAYAVVGVLVAILLCNICLFVYAERHPSILREEPIGLLGNAELLYWSDVGRFVEEFRKNHETEKNIRDCVKDDFTMKELKCWWDNEQGRIRIEGLDAKGK